MEKLFEYTKDDKRGLENSPKKEQFPKKTVKVVAERKGKKASNREDKRNKGNRQYITSIVGGTHRENNPSKSMMNRNIFELMVVIKKEESLQLRV